MDITPKDQVETKALGIGQRISVALGIVVAMGSALLAAFGDMKWITDNLPLLATGLGGLATGGVTAFVAVRRMRLDRLGKIAPLLAFILLPSSFILISTGCVMIRADSNDTGASVWALGWGSDSSAQLANVAVTGPQTNMQTGVSFDSANGEQQSYQAIQSLVKLGVALAPILAGVPAASPSAASAAACSADAAPAEADTASDVSADGYDGVPGPAGEGVYGRPSCARCRAYKSAHPDADIINIDAASNRADMWAALRLRGFAGGNVALPVAITASAFTLAAK